ncbi:hypothetical protein BRARA_G00888 [Brassica rapa]|uniref:Plant thionin family protein n=4 Tax=Brassica TaxID=3705 RepID=A0ABQ8CLV2_BRANA|nr:hypothetical protein IGI04_026741 [Brassica rapa subsp. trilocularis]KAH0918045.1 hypothetical protein HID58_025705 [Brassica napus]RID53501.1 hypothetical protein BRARA_G00888 [Brassica rapa]CDY64688.1 BnaA07g37170D [Brassica napus]VDC97443.1 unnamed protein product [Brassica rapa]
MKTQVTIVAALMILVALSSTLDMVKVTEAQVNCIDSCTTGCVKPTPKETIRCHHECDKKCSRGGKGGSETGA